MAWLALGKPAGDSTRLQSQQQRSYFYYVGLQDRTENGHQNPGEGSSGIVHQTGAEGCDNNQAGSESGNRYPGLSLFPFSNLPVSAMSQTKLEAHGKKNCVSGLYNLASQGTEHGGEGWTLGLKGQK